MQGETETLQRVTGGHLSVLECAEKIQGPRLEKERNHLLCALWSHLLLSVSGRAFSWGILLVIHIKNQSLMQFFCTFVKCVYNIYPNLWHPDWQPGGCCQTSTSWSKAPLPPDWRGVAIWRRTVELKFVLMPESSLLFSPEPLPCPR